MTKKAYISSSDKAKLTRKLYVSVNGQAKPVKRAYCSVGGQAKIFYDTAVVSYIDDNGYTNNTTVSATERIAVGSHATQRNSKRWYKSDGTEWNFTNDTVSGDITLYEAVYQTRSSVTFDGSHYVPTDVKLNINSWDQRGACTPTNIASQRRTFSVAGNRVIEMYINGSGYWNVGVGNSQSSVQWSAASNKVKAAVNARLSWRFNLATSSTKYFQLWQGSQSAVWSSVTAVSSAALNSGINIGYSLFDPDASGKPFIGTIEYINFGAGGSTDGQFDAYQRIKGGSTVQGFAWNKTHKFYPLAHI